MALSQADRIAFSLSIVSSAVQVAGLASAQSQTQTQINSYQALDTANMNLFSPVNALINSYQIEAQSLDGNGRTSILEQDLQNAANKIQGNYFFPNVTAVTIPDLAPYNNIWTQVKPFALGYGIGKTVSETYTSVTNETTLISQILALISSASAYQNIELTSGQYAPVGTCSLPEYTTEAACTTAGGTWTEGTVETYSAVQTLKSNIVTAISSLVTLLNTELAAIPNDPNNQANNTATKNEISNVILPALTTWLGYPDFNPVPSSVTTYSEFYAYNPALLAPTKLYSADLTALKSALESRQTFIATRISQLQTVLGTIVQDVTTGNITSSSGLYGQRYGYLELRIDALTGSLTMVVSLQNSVKSQTSISNSLTANANTYLSILPTTLLISGGNGTSTISVQNANSFNQGDTVYIYAEGQTELLRAVKTVLDNSLVLNDVVPAKYLASNNARMYKDLT